MDIFTFVTSVHFDIVWLPIGIVIIWATVGVTTQKVQKHPISDTSNIIDLDHCMHALNKYLWILVGLKFIITFFKCVWLLPALSIF